MSCLTSVQKTNIQAEIASYEEQLALLNQGIKATLGTGIKSYKIDSGEGSQQVTYMTPKEMLDQKRLIMNQITVLNQKLNCTRTTSVKMRRRGW